METNKDHLTKKEKRAIDQQQRESLGDHVHKDTVGEYEAHKRDPKLKDDYEPYADRPHDRHSGTGKPAFTHTFKKGGHGKGNIGTLNDQIEAEKNDEEFEEEERQLEKERFGK